MLKTKNEVMKQVGKIYKDLITLQELGKTPDGQGGFKKGVLAEYQVYAFVNKPKVATETEAGAIVSELTYQINLPDRLGVPDVQKGWLVLCGSKKFEVEHAYINNYDREKVLICREVVK